jgi:hypothetical protein
MTGGTLEYQLRLTNAGAHPCVLASRPAVRVPVSAFPVVVGDVGPGAPGGGTASPVRLAPDATASAEVEVWRPCAGARNEMTSGAVSVGYGRRFLALHVDACRRQGSEIRVGAFRRAG